MTKKKIFIARDWISAYSDFVLKNDHSPSSVYAFTRSIDREESEFYRFFASFKTLESEVFKSLLESSINTLKSSEEFDSYDTRNQLLGFYYTFFENLTSNRSFILFLLKDNKDKLKGLASLGPLREGFIDFVKSLKIDSMDLKQEQLEKIKNRSIQETAWIQLLITLKFWMEDTSASFEKTDIFIEKSINTSFDLMDTKPLRSLIDLGKFMVKEKMNTNL